MKLDSKIYVAGHNGLVGSAIVRKLLNYGYKNLLLKSSSELDLRDSNAVSNFFRSERPDYVFFAAGLVGGIMANKTSPADFIFDNVTIIFNTVKYAYQNNVTKLLYLGSSCIYPKSAPQPLKEEYLMSGFLEETNKSYAIAKIAGIELCFSYNKQYGTDYIALMPTNIFGLNDNYDAQNSHLVAALIRKFYEAKINKRPSVELWGSGNPRREILSSDHLADACIYFMNNYTGNEIVNIGSGVDYSIREIALFIQKIVDYEGEVHFDTSKPEGVFKKQLDISKATNLGWTPEVDIIKDLKVAVTDFINNYSKYKA